MSDFLNLFDKSTARGRLFHLINEMTSEQQAALLKQAEELVGPHDPKDVRRSRRDRCSTTAYIAHKHRIFKNVVTDISDGGVFIETQEPLLVGETILVSVKGPGKKNRLRYPAKLSGKTAAASGSNSLSHSGRKTLAFRRRLQCARAVLIIYRGPSENFCAVFVVSSADLESV